MNRARLLLAALLAIALLATAGPALAGSTQTGVLRGKVTAEDGSPLPGVTLTLSSPAQIRDRAVVTDGDGNFFVPGLAPGDYRVTAQLSGFTTIVVDTQVVLDQTTVLPVVLREGELTETVTVTGAKPVVDKTGTESAVVLDKEFTENLPVGRSYQSLLQFAPGVTGGSNPNILGGTSNSNVYLVDGVSIRDPVTGTFGGNLNFDAIEAVDIKLTGVSAEYGQFQGGLTNVITKSGGNTFTGSVRNVIDKGRWQSLYHSKAGQYFIEDEIPFSNQYADEDNTWVFTPEFTAGGPIVPDSAWFFISYRRPERSQGAALLNRFGGPNGDGVYNNTFEGNYSTGKVTWQIFEDHRVQMQYTEDPADTTRDYGALFFGPGAFDTESIDFQSQGGFVWVGNWNASWTPTIFTDFKVARFKNSFGIRPLTPIEAPFPDMQLSGTGEVGFYWDFLQSGGVYDANIFDETPEDRLRDQFEGSVTAFFDTSIGTHTIKVGADYQEQERLGSSIIQGNAYFIGTFGQDPTDLVSPGNPRDINNRSYYIWYDFAPPTGAGPTNEYTAIYIQDDWQVNENLALNLGVRYEQSVNENDIGEKIIDQDDFAPRLGVSWDITGEAKHVVKGTAARYLAGINLTTLSPFVRNAGGQSSYDVYVNTDFSFSAPYVTGIPSWLLVAQVRPSTEAAQFADGLNVQYIDELTLGYEYAFSPTLGASIKVVDRTWDEITTVSYSYVYPGGSPLQISQIDNNPNAKRDYQAVILQADKRFSNNWQALFSYTYSESEGNVTSDSGFSVFGAYDTVVQDERNRFGLLPWDTKHDIKIQGFYSIPLRSNRHSITIGGVFDHSSGNPYGLTRPSTQVVVGPGADGIQNDPLGTEGTSLLDQTASITVYDEQRGSRREPSVWDIDLNFTYAFQFSQKVRFETRFEIFNVTNEQRPVTLRTSGARFGYAGGAGDLQVPQSYRLNLALIW